MQKFPSPKSSYIPDSPLAAHRPSVALIDGRGWLYIQEQYCLTSRERQIAELVCLGDKNDSIAQTLNISPGTVKTHLRNIYRKVRVQSKIAMLLHFVAAIRHHAAG